MARMARSVLGPPTLPDLSCGVELLVIRTRLEYPPFDEQSAPTEETATFLVLYDPELRARMLARAYAATLLTAWSFEQPTVNGDGNFVFEAAAELQRCDARIVVALPPHTPAAELRVGRLLRSLSAAVQRLELVAAVASEPPAWRELHAASGGGNTGLVSGFVGAEVSAVAETALQLLEFLLTLVAPILLYPATVEELLEMLGPPEEPSQLRHYCFADLPAASATLNAAQAIAVCMSEPPSLAFCRWCLDEIRVHAGQAHVLPISGQGVSVRGNHGVLALTRHCHR